jgi:hypothetical protein
MSRRTSLNAVVEDVLSELESELEGESLEAEDAGKVSCAGWETDPQSFSIRAALNFAQDAFNNSALTPGPVVCSGKVCTVRLNSQGGWPAFDITVDLSQVPGVVSVSGTAVLFLRPKACSYTYSCDALGPISFTRINCRLL